MAVQGALEACQSLLQGTDLLKQRVRTPTLAMHLLCFGIQQGPECTTALQSALTLKIASEHCDSPDPRQGPESPFPGKEGFAKNPISPRHGKGIFFHKIPFFCKGTQGKWGFLDRKLPFPGRVRVWGMGVSGPRNPLFQEMGIRGPLWGRGLIVCVWNPLTPCFPWAAARGGVMKGGVRKRKCQRRKRTHANADKRKFQAL